MAICFIVGFIVCFIVCFIICKLCWPFNTKTNYFSLFVSFFFIIWLHWRNTAKPQQSKQGLLFCATQAMSTALRQGCLQAINEEAAWWLCYWLLVWYIISICCQQAVVQHGSQAIMIRRIVIIRPSMITLWLVWFGYELAEERDIMRIWFLFAVDAGESLPFNCSWVVFQLNVDKQLISPVIFVSQALILLRSK